MVLLTPHFSIEEFTQSHHGIYNDCPISLAANLVQTGQKAEEARGILSEQAARECTLRVAYGYRCEAENEACGGSPTSAHCEGLAVDLVPNPDLFHLRQAFEVLAQHPTFMADVDQLIIERGCLHIGLPTSRHNFVPRHELRGDSDVDGHRTYPLLGIWTPPSGQ